MKNEDAVYKIRRSNATYYIEVVDDIVISVNHPAAKWAKGKNWSKIVKPWYERKNRNPELIKQPNEA